MLRCASPACSLLTNPATDPLKHETNAETNQMNEEGMPHALQISTVRSDWTQQARRHRVG